MCRRRALSRRRDSLSAKTFRPAPKSADARTFPPAGQSQSIANPCDVAQIVPGTAKGRAPSAPAGSAATSAGRAGSATQPSATYAQGYQEGLPRLKKTTRQVMAHELMMGRRW